MKLLLLISMMGFSLLWATVYTVDPENSLVSFKIRHAVIAKVEGKFNEFSGTYAYDDAGHYFVSFEGEAKMTSVDTDEKYRDEHLRKKVFDVEHYPNMTLKMIKQNGRDFQADLTIKGIRKRVDFHVALNPKQEDSFFLMGEISRRDFNLTFSDMAELGGIAVGDKVEINIIFSGIKRD